MLTFIRRIFGWYDRRVSDDVRWVLAKAHHFAVSSGSDCVTTTHVLAAISLHPTGLAVFGRDAGKIFDEASHSQPPGPPLVAEGGRLPLQGDVKALVQQSLKARESAGWTTVEVEHFLLVLIAMPDASATPLLRKYRFAPPEDAAAG